MQFFKNLSTKSIFVNFRNKTFKTIHANTKSNFFKLLQNLNFWFFKNCSRPISKFSFNTLKKIAIKSKKKCKNKSFKSSQRNDFYLFFRLILTIFLTMSLAQAVVVNCRFSNMHWAVTLASSTRALFRMISI